MKKFYFLLIVLFNSFCLQTFAQNAKEDLVGVWQQYQEVMSNDGTKRILHLPVWKVLQSDGNFFIFLIASKDGTSIITHKGTYEYVSEGVYHEFVEKSIVNTNLIGKSNVMNYHVDENGRMSVSYRLPGASEDGREIWQKVKMEVPTENQKP